ncbi:MAG: LysM peptidoglycan-binding domain-containing protein [Desulfuromonadales bacterium]|nr:LysM peptidoglycan-binding domain-containing protein [Desulfuromonadales bacterium]
MKSRLKLLLLALTLAVPCLAVAAEQSDLTIYVIKQGDTLWGLSERFVKDPKYWPDMWSKNREITNPHVIYPGQKARVFPDRLEFVPKEELTGQSKKETAAASAVPETFSEVSGERTYSVRGSEGFILESAAKPSGTIISLHNNRHIGGDDDIVYTDIGKERGARGGEKFSVFRRDANISHPVTNEILGTKIIPLGTIQLTDLEKNASRAIITKAHQEIIPGSYLLPALENNRREISLKMSSKELKGYIVDSFSGSNIIAAGDIVYIDLGRVQGAEPGNMLYVVRDVTIDASYATGYTEKLPQELLGALVILETGEKTATALIVKSIDAIFRGDKLLSQPK